MIQYDSMLASLPPVNILVCGYTGAGKTTLIQSVFGSDYVSDDKVGHGTPKTASYTPYKRERLTLWDSKGLEPGNEGEAFLEDTIHFIDSNAVKEKSRVIDIAWYCIQLSGARVTPYDIKLIEEISSRVPLIVVLTKKDISKKKQVDSMRKELHKARIDKRSALTFSENDSESVINLLDATKAIIPLECFKILYINTLAYAFKHDKKLFWEISRRYLYENSLAVPF